MNFLDRFHGGYIHQRRVCVLSEHLADLIPQNSRVLDVGCGDGLLAYRIMQRRYDLDVQGIDVLVRNQTYIPSAHFDGLKIPYGDASFDVVLLVDVLHHTEDPMILLREAIRTARQAVVIKDHTLEGFLSGFTLCLMDWVGNARHGITLLYNYWPRQKWFQAFDILGWTIDVWRKELRLYPRPLNWVCGRSLHFVARLTNPQS